MYRPLRYITDECFGATLLSLATAAAPGGRRCSAKSS